AARLRPLRGGRMRAGLELVGERLELGRIAAGRVRERVFEEPVGKPRISRQERAVQVRADRACQPAALEAALAVVAEPRDDAPERLGVRVEVRAACVVLETGDRPR